MADPGLFLLRMGEMGTKSAPVRRRWERLLRQNLEEIFLAAGKECVTRNDHGHLYVATDDADAAQVLLLHAFGVTSFSPVIELRTDLEEIGRVTVGLAGQVLQPGESFAIRPRRTGTHTFTSQELGRQVGARVYLALKDRGIRVDLKKPDREIEIEVRQDRTYISVARIPGPGGLPYGCEGKVVGIVKDWRWAVASWLLMKRGCRLVPLAWGEEGRKAVGVLSAWTGQTKVFASDAPDFGGAISDATGIALRRKASAIVTGLTFADLKEGTPKGRLPIFYPLAGYAPDRVIALGRQIGFPGADG